jgi:hypothetical protein
MKPGVVFQCWDDFYKHKHGPVGVIVDIDWPCTCTHIVAQINQLRAKPLPEHYHLECQPVMGKQTQDTRFWHSYMLADGKCIDGRFYLEKIEDITRTISKTEPVEVQLQMDF